MNTAAYLREGLPAAWYQPGLQSDLAALNVAGCVITVSRLPFGPDDRRLTVCVVEDGADPVRFVGRCSARLDIIDAVVECVRRAVHAERPISAADVPEWAHREVVKAQRSIMQSGAPWALYEALVREIVGGRFPPPWANPPH